MTPTEDFKKKLHEDKKKQAIETQRILFEISEKSKLSSNETASAPQIPEEEEEKQQWPNGLKPFATKPENIQKINNAFDAQFPQTQREDNLLTFESYEDAKHFFQELTKQGIQFLIKEQDEDHYFYSNGKNLFEGSFNELQAHLEKQALKEKQYGFKSKIVGGDEPNEEMGSKTNRFKG